MSGALDLIPGLTAAMDKSRQGQKRGLQDLCNLLTTAMGQDPAHGDVTSASHTNYAAYVVGDGETGEEVTDSQVAVVEALNPGHSSTGPLEVPDGAIGAVLSSATDYQRKLETENAAQRAVLGPTIQGSAEDFTRYAAEGSRRALAA